jgi:hypothetical protein
MLNRSRAILFLVLVFAMSVSSMVFLSCSGKISSPCTPQCDGMQCGDDQCGGTCPPGCANNETCNTAGQCISCTPQCDGLQCGDNGCGGNCGLCDEPASCQEGQCIVQNDCQPPCNETQCQVCIHQTCESRCFGTEVCSGGICQEPSCNPPCNGNVAICADSVCKTFAELKNEYIGSHPGQAIIPYPWEPITSTRVLPFNYEIPAAPGNVVSISACRGQFEAASFVITAQKDLSEITIDVPNLYTAQGNSISADAIDVRLVKVWYQAAANDIWLDHNEYILAPELLLKDDSLVDVNYVTETNTLKVTINGVPQTIDISNPAAVFPSNAEIHDATALQPFSLKANENKQIWVTVHVPSNTPSGDYYGDITLSAPSETPVNMKLGVRVLLFDLEPSPLEYSIYYRGMVYSGTRDGINSEWKAPVQYSLELQNMKEHGVLYPTMYQEEDYEIETALQLRSQSGLPKDHLYTCNSIRTTTNSDSATINASVARLQAEQSKASTYGFGKLYVYAIDEANADTLLLERPSMIALRNNGAGIYVACYHDAITAVADLLDIAVVAGAIDTSQAELWHGYGQKIFSYANPQVGIENPAVYRKNYGLALWNGGYDGAMDYAYQHGYGHIWNDYDSVADHYRDHVFAYPTSNGVIDTIQWEGFREGVDDTRYLATLNSTMGNDTLARSIVTDSLSKNESMSTIRKKVIKEILSH